MNRFLACLAIAFATGSAAAVPPPHLFLEDLTSPEVQLALRSGTTTVIIPVGGTEQNGPHMTLGKHNVRVRALAARIAQELGNAVVAPVLAYVPEGSIDPPSAHMRFPGTISIPDNTFRSLLESSARSLRRHGFTDVVLIGDHGGYQSQMAAVATRLNRDWAKTPARVHFIADYYLATERLYVRALQAQGVTDAQIGTHAGTADTSLMLAVDPSVVHADKLAAAAQGGAAVGVSGDPRPSTAALGRLGVEAIVDRSVAAIRSAIAARR
jgi:creatinine amidohydrolase